MVQPQSVPPQKKGTNVWLWVALGCVGILIVAGIAVGGLAWWGAHKVKAYAEDFQKHPETAFVRGLAAMNPDVEVVSTDDANGKVTVRNKKTGETMTIDMKDAKSGNIRFQTPQGTLSTKASDSNGTPSVEIKGANGEVASFGGGAKLPDWVFGYPGATSEGVYSAESNAQVGGTFAISTTDSFDKVFDYFKGQLKSAGYNVSETRFGSGAAQGGMVSGQSADDKRSLAYTLSSENGKTKVAGVYSLKKG